jgi:hypothetical protein
LAADFTAGHCVGPPDLAVRGQALESVVLAAGENPSIMSFLFRPIRLELAEVPLKDAVLLCSELANVAIRMDLRSLEEASISPDLKISANTGDLPLFVNLSQLLRPVGLDCDFRYGMLRVVALSSLTATWKDPTCITQIVPSPGSNLAQEWKKFTTVDVREMPLKDVVLYLQETHRVPFDISLMPTSPAANSPFTTQDSAVTASLRGITFRDALATILSQLHCKASVRGEVIVIEPQ